MAWTRRLYCNKNVPLLALDLLARIVPCGSMHASFSALFTLWLSMMAAVGLLPAPLVPATCS